MIEVKVKKALMDMKERLIFDISEMNHKGLRLVKVLGSK